MASNTFLHTVDKRATPAIWRESVAKGVLEKEKNASLAEQSVEDMIAERQRELIQMSSLHDAQFELTVGSKRYEQITRLSAMSTKDFNAEHRKNWKLRDYLLFAGRMLVLLLRCFKNRRKYVEEFDYITNPNIEKPVPRMTKNRAMLRVLTCQPQFRTEEDLEKIRFYLQPTPELTVLFPKDMQKELYRLITYSDFDHGRIIGYQNVRPQRFYFVMEGKINLIKNIQLSDGKTVSKSIGWLSKHDLLNVNDVENVRLTEYQMIAVGTAQVLYLNTDDLQTLRKFNERIPRTFLRSLPLFKDYPLESLLEHPGAVESLFFEPNKMVCKNLKSSEYFYICKSGTCSIVRRQHVVDVKKSGDFGHPVQSADDLASRRIFLHAYETMDSTLKTTSVMEYLDIKRPSMAQNKLRDQKKNKLSLLDRYSENKNKVITRNSFLKIGQFARNNIAGLHEQQMTHREGVTNLSLVSEGAEIVKIHKKRFLLLAIPRTLTEIQVLFATYRLEREVQEEVAERESWTHYRKQFVTSFLSDKQKMKMMQQPRGNPNLVEH
ncbi:uncharacterized protein LOC134856693 [Symsagittifera roscoffensis]|uniref:uncharacterized protein LOC134856693 n=1 Tax=Symsagittifera roscoffensis TaxID=84072 RepID=UPI00307BF526